MSDASHQSAGLSLSESPVTNHQSPVTRTWERRRQISVGNPKKEQIFADLLTILNELTDDWEYSEEISYETSLFDDLGFESIDAVALGTAIEEHYRQSLPFAEFLAEIGQREEQDIRVDDLVEFIYKNLSVS
ncbi:MAG: acyl carrier protein [Candidatus Poribacteria bacterium]